EQVRITAARGGEAVELSVVLPERWWWTDLTFRQWTVEPRVYFESVPLTEAEKREHGLGERGGFSSRGKRADSFAEMMKSHDLRVGDIIFGVDGVERDEVAHTAELFIKLRKKAGETATLDVIRDGQRLQMPLKTYRMNFRK